MRHGLKWACTVGSVIGWSKYSLGDTSNPLNSWYVTWTNADPVQWCLYAALGGETAFECPQWFFKWSSITVWFPVYSLHEQWNNTKLSEILITVGDVEIYCGLFLFRIGDPQNGGGVELVTLWKRLMIKVEWNCWNIVRRLSFKSSIIIKV